MLYNEKDKQRVCRILIEELEKRQIDYCGFKLNKIASDLLDIIYAEGGAFSESIIRDFSIDYIDSKLYERFR